MNSEKWDKLSRTEQNYLDCECCGAKWLRLLDGKRSLVMPSDIEGLRELGLIDAKETESICQIHSLPNYLSDLNAMDQAEQSLTNKQYNEYSALLFDWAKICGPTGRWFSDNKRKYLSAPPYERAKAFVMIKIPEPKMDVNKAME